MLSSGEILHASLGGSWAAKPDLRSREGNFDVESSSECGGVVRNTIHILRRTCDVLFKVKCNCTK